MVGVEVGTVGVEVAVPDHGPIQPYPGAGVVVAGVLGGRAEPKKRLQYPRNVLMNERARLRLIRCERTCPLITVWARRHAALTTLAGSTECDAANERYEQPRAYAEFSAVWLTFASPASELFMYDDAIVRAFRGLCLVLADAMLVAPKMRHAASATEARSEMGERFTELLPPVIGRRVL